MAQSKALEKLNAFYLYLKGQISVCAECVLTPQQWEGAVLQLHDDALQHGQHGGDVQQDQGDGLRNNNNKKHHPKIHKAWPGKEMWILETTMTHQKNVTLKCSFWGNSHHGDSAFLADIKGNNEDSQMFSYLYVLSVMHFFVIVRQILQI